MKTGDNSETANSHLSTKVDASQLRQQTTLSDLSLSEPADQFVGQARAFSAVELATRMTDLGYNLFVAAPKDLPVRANVKKYLAEAAGVRQPIADYVYVYNFEQPSAPRLLTLPPGSAPRVADTFEELIRDLREAIPAAFDKPEVQTRRRALENAFKEQQETAFEELGQEAQARGVAILRGPMGFSLAPMQNDELMKPDELKSMDEAEQESRKAAISEIQQKLESIVREIPKWERNLRADLRELERQTIENAITQSIEATERELCELPEACEHLQTVKSDLIQNYSLFSAVAMQHSELPPGLEPQNPFERYSINVLVTRSDKDVSTPVIEESNPTLAHLVGRIEHVAEGGYLTTSFKLIKPGALHLANGGFLILDARNLLTEPMSWPALKRALKTEAIKIENLAQALNLSSTISLDPEPVPLSARIILIGDPWIYHILSTYDPEFSTYFKLFADFEDSMPRTEENETLLAWSYIDFVRSHDLLQIDNDALGYLVEEAAREAGDAKRLSVKTEKVRDILLEADHYAKENAETTISRQQVEFALQQQIYRAGRIKDRLHEQLLREIALVDTEGSRIGQINGLSVYELAGTAFGKPSRITARTRPGRGQVVDIERESKLGGPIHSKGVMVLSGYLAGRYALQYPLSLHASLVLEQSYGGVEGDSASLAELLALLSALSQQPISQSVAVTGAVNQLGDVQAIGGANQKIEGFFDLCKDRGLTGQQGVIIPSSNVQHLMLISELVQACSDNQFAVYGVASVDEAIPLVFGMPSKKLHGLVERRLSQFAVAINGISHQSAERTAQIEDAPFPLPGEEGPPADPPDAPPREPPKSYSD